MTFTEPDTSNYRVLNPNDKGIQHVVYARSFTNCILVHVGVVGQGEHKLPEMSSLMASMPHYVTTPSESPVTTLINGKLDDDARAICSRLMTKFKQPLLLSFNIGEMFSDERIDFHSNVLNAVHELLKNQPH
eukprot:Gregarina_sp_Poly_1__1672@NODE_1429_length_4170_cov_73_020473_g927_i1_p3_GENE_NODE_1429_length_4170_cov_73_020473_g927_i1NODE_1429_length_4170_cov_73_020473_g927_i1_p3_ORF_typecomplete_len132_score7_00PAC4/PF16093_5/9_9e08_NODE_1429_length_4170_cov_73_020473_g927_i127613156